MCAMKSSVDLWYFFHIRNNFSFFQAECVSYINGTLFPKIRPGCFLIHLFLIRGVFYCIKQSSTLVSPAEYSASSHQSSDCNNHAGRQSSKLWTIWSTRSPPHFCSFLLFPCRFLRAYRTRTLRFLGLCLSLADLWETNAFTDQYGSLILPR